MGLSETFREIQQARLDEEHDNKAPEGCAEYFNRCIERSVIANDLLHYDTETHPDLTGWASRVPPVLGYLGVRMTEIDFAILRDQVIAEKNNRDARRANGESVGNGIRGVAGLPAWAVREIFELVNRCGPAVTLAVARTTFVVSLRKQLAALPPLGEKPTGYDDWLREHREADEDTEWTAEDDESLGGLMR